MKGLRRLRGFVTSCRAALSSPRRTSWLSHRLLSSSHCAALLSSCHASWLSHCLSLSSRCATLSSSCFASFLSYCFSSSSCCSAHSSSRRVDWLLRRLLTRHPLVVSPSCRLVVSLSRCLVVSSSCRLVVLPSRRLVISLCRPLVVLSRQLVVASSLIVAHCAALSSSHHAGWLLRCLTLCTSRPLIVRQPSFASPSPCRSPSPTPSKTVECYRHHQTPPPPPPLNAISYFHCPLLPQQSSITTVKHQ